MGCPATASVEASELREVSHDHVDVLPVPTCSSTQVKAEAAVERWWSGGGAVVTASARAPIRAPLSRAHLEVDGAASARSTL